MNKVKKILALALVAVMMLALSVSAFAAGATPSITIKPNDTTPAAEGKITITYTYYKILTAEIDTDPTVGLDGTTTAAGTAAYYVTNSAQATAIAGLKKGENAIFNVTKVDGVDKWYVELNTDTNASGEDIATAFNNDTFLSNFTAQTYTNSAGGDATLPDVSAGYYFIKSSLGSKMAVQTLSPVTINEKNEYVTDDKTIPEVDKSSQIGQEITYTLTVNVPVTATEQIVLTDTMSKGLTFKEVKSQKIGTTDATDAQKGAVSAVTAADGGATKFTITFTAEQVKALVADGTAKTINIEVVVTVNAEAVVDTDIENTLDMKYGNNYDAVSKPVTTRTTKLEFDKVDGTDKTTKLTGAEFQLLKKTDGSVIKLVEVEAGKTYRIATADEITAAAATLKDKIVTNGNTVTINGVDGDLTYQLKETKAPTGYNLMNPDTVDITPTDKVFTKQTIENNKGQTLPSTGGIGTTIFYVVGALLVVGAGVVLVTRRKVDGEN